jgi:DNA-binding CsgD family transcriptional regulator
VEHIHSCLASPREERLPSALSWLQNFTYCESIVLCHLCLADRIRFKHLVNHSYQPQWIRIYLAEDFANVDLVIHYAQSTSSHLVPVLHAAACGLDTGTPKPALSRREREVLKWASDGKTVREIGKILSLSESTVKFHLGNIYKKLGVINRAPGIATAVRYDLI